MWKLWLVAVCLMSACASPSRPSMAVPAPPSASTVVLDTGVVPPPVEVGPMPPTHPHFDDPPPPEAVPPLPRFDDLPKPQPVGICPPWAVPALGPNGPYCAPKPD